MSLRTTPAVLLSFDTEEFDLPREHGTSISLSEAVEISAEGMNRILDILQRQQVTATFFCTVNMAENAPQVMQRIISQGHEVASHGIDHWQPRPEHVAQSKARLEALCGKPVNGYRQPRMMSTGENTVAQAGYRYDSSLHPTFIVGRYMHLRQPRTPFIQNGVLQIPASVTPVVRIPVFWLACHHYPQWLYHRLCKWTLRHDGLFVIYFHPWEFLPLDQHPEWHIPYIIKHRCGDEMTNRLESLITMFKHEDAEFITFNDYVLGNESAFCPKK